MVKYTIMSGTTVDPRIKKFKNIIAVNPYTQKYYQYRDQSLTAIESLEFNPHNFVISYIANRDMIITAFDLGMAVDEDELDDTFYMKAYEELGLDPEKEYKIFHQKADPEDKNSYVYNLFITEPEVIENSVAATVDQTRYIDLLIPAPLLFRTLYTSGIVEASEAHCFIYFTMTDAFVTIYDEGKFIYSKSLEFSLTQLYEKYCAAVGERVDEKKFFETLETEGLKAGSTVYQQTLMKLFGEIFLQINDIIIYTKRAYNIDIIQRLFVGSAKSPIIGLGDYGYNYLGIQTYNLDYSFDMKNDEWYVDQLQSMMVRTGLDYIDNSSQVVNMTTTPRPPVFRKRASGQFIISTTTASLVALAIPLVYLILSYFNDVYIIQLKTEDDELSKISTRYERILGEKQAIIKDKTNELNGRQAVFDAKSKTLISIYNKKVDYRLKSELFDRFARDLTEHEVKLEQMSSQNNSFMMYMVSDDEKKITKYIKDVSKKYFDDIKNINIERISNDYDDGLYRGILKVSYR